MTQSPDQVDMVSKYQAPTTRVISSKTSQLRLYSFIKIINKFGMNPIRKKYVKFYKKPELRIHLVHTH